MKSITIHNLDSEIAREIEKLAKEKDLSLNKTIKKLLEKALGKDERNRQGLFDDLSGTWSKKDSNEFNKTIEDLSKIEQSEWL